ncbi:hypothetical protein BOX15_Mlig012893g1 [Macrostomum lignano]|uniref:Amidohydrolase-related domain-containing protein n=1 Tax=Macrostomum lignano TaxID=282301 RepID=A0A267ETH3_9PLAT|nr:hypothetical protein BOX15_Mlig012893g1 [Macrostomum lignano]
MLTHLFSAMGPFHHRQPHLPGLLVSEAARQPVYYGLIADCDHTHRPRCASPGDPASRLILVSDACPARGLPDGRHSFGGVDVDVAGGLCRLAGLDTLAGSMVTLADCVQRMHLSGVCPPERTLEAASLHPADMLGLRDRGRIEPGALADFVLLDSDLRLLRTFVRACPSLSNEQTRLTDATLADPVATLVSSFMMTLADPLSTGLTLADPCFNWLDLS